MRLKYCNVNLIELIFQHQRIFFESSTSVHLDKSENLSGISRIELLTTGICRRPMCNILQNAVHKYI